MVLYRRCAVCGRELTITVNEDGTYSGGHYFGKITIGRSKQEYWECDECYNSGD